MVKSEITTFLTPPLFCLADFERLPQFPSFSEYNLIPAGLWRPGRVVFPQSGSKLAQIGRTTILSVIFFAVKLLK